LPGGPVTICRASTGGLWVASGSKLWHWRDGGLQELGTTVPDGGEWPPSCMLETRDGKVWLATRTEGLMFHAQGKLVPLGTSHKMLNCLLEDEEGNLWAGTAGGGLNCLRRARFEVAAANATDTVGSICEDAAQRQWLANSLGVWRIERGEAVPAFPKGTRPDDGQAVCPDKDGNVWIGTNDGIFLCKPGENQPPHWLDASKGMDVNALYCARDGSMWAGCRIGPLLRFNGGEVRQYGKEQGYGDSVAQAFGEDAAGNLWVGTRRGMLFSMSADGQFHSVTFPHGAIRPGILCIHGDKQNNLWAGTSGQGLLVLRNGRFSLLGSEHGLPDTMISQLLEDEFGMLWVGSSRALFRVNKQDLLDCADGKRATVLPAIFGSRDGINGFYANGQRQPCAWKSGNGNLWFVGRKGVITAQPWQEEPPARPATVLIDATQVDGKQIRMPADLLVPPGAGPVRIDYTVPTFAYAQNLHFHYRLAGQDNRWTEAGEQRFAVFSGLSPGKYVFEVSAENPKTGWKINPASLRVTVLPQWWERSSVQIAGILAAALLLAALVRAAVLRRMRQRMLVMEQAQRVEKERARIARDLHDGLGAGLTEAGLFAAEMRQDAAEGKSVADAPIHLGERIHKLARELDAAVWAVSPRHDNLDSLGHYLCEFTLEHFKHSAIRSRIDADDALPHLPVEPSVRHHLFMAAKEALNNVLKHSRATDVRLGIHLADGRLLVSVSDNGGAFDPDAAGKSGRSGLRHMHERMAEIGGGCTIESGAGGTTVRLTVPLACLSKPG
jgi:signal transduction histidine kinase